MFFSHLFGLILIDFHLGFISLRFFFFFIDSFIYSFHLIDWFEKQVGRCWAMITRWSRPDDPTRFTYLQSYTEFPDFIVDPKIDTGLAGIIIRSSAVDGFTHF